MAVMETLAQWAHPLLEVPYIRRIRRNHGLEHATIHMLTRKRYRISGHSSGSGFVLFGDVPTDKVEAAVREALMRMRNGERQLAIHPNCGTNLVTAGLLTTSIAALGFMGTNRRSAWDRFPVVMFFMMMAVMYSQPLGMRVQKYFTTSGEPGEMELIGVQRSETTLPFGGKATVHRIITRRG